MTRSPSSRRRAGLAAAAAAAVALPVCVAAPASAQDGAGTALSGATRGTAITITLNLPQGNQAQLVLDPVSGTVRTTGTTPEAQATAALVAGSIGDQGQSFGEASASLTGERQADGPAEPFNAGVAGTPLAEFLSLELLDSGAQVGEEPSSTSEARIASLGVGLPAALVEGLAPALDPIRAGVTTLLTELAGGAENIQALCDGLSPIGAVTEPVAEGVAGIPVVGTIVEELVGEADEGEIAALCELDEILLELEAELSESLDTLVGPGGVLGTGLIGARQSITTVDGRVTATAEASIADLTVLGTSPFGTVEALQTTSVASTDGTDATATVERTAVGVVANPVVTLVTDLTTLTGELVGIDLAGVNELVVELQALIEALSGIGIEAGPLDVADAAIETCPTALDGGLSGTFEAGDGSCAVAASRGYGLAVTLPEAIAGPAGIEGPLVEIAIVPTAAVVSAAPLTVAAPPPVQVSLPRTGPEAALAGTGLALLLGAAAVRRRRAATAEV